MKILLAHNYYRSTAPSGEDAVFHNEKSLLEKSGVSLVVYEKFNDDIVETGIGNKIRLGLNGAWSASAYKEVRDIISRTNPDLAHFHNTFPLISPSAYAACQDAGVPTVQTLHNYRFICPGALLMRDGKPCEDCVGGTLIPALIHRCYRNSITATSAQVWTIASNRWRGTYKNNINRYIALTRFAADRYIAGGLPGDKIEIKPNFLPDPPAAGNGQGGYAVYVGRLSAEKGVRTLMSAWKHISDLPLKILGDGPLRLELENVVREGRINAEFMGFRPRSDILDIVGNAVFQIVPSEWYEGFPMVILEAYACGTPVLVSAIGSLNEIVNEGDTGLKFMPGDADDLVRKIHSLQSDPDRLAAMRQSARQEFDSKYTQETVIEQQMTIYCNAIDDLKRHRRRV